MKRKILVLGALFMAMTLVVPAACAADGDDALMFSAYPLFNDTILETEYEKFRLTTENEKFKINSKSYFLLAQAEAGAEQAKGGDKAQMSGGELMKQISNPVGNLWMLVMQYDVTVRDIESFGDNQILHNFKFMPVMPVPLTDEWRLITRPVFQINAYNIPGSTPAGSTGLPDPPPPGAPVLPGGMYDTDFGLGDTIFLTAFSNSALKSAWQYGFGPTWIFPTATEDTLGARKWAVGPGGALVYMGGPGSFMAGALVQQWWSFAGPGNSDVSLMDIQYILKYRWTDTVSIGFAPNIQIDWENDQYQVPIGMGIDFMTKIGKVPMKVVVEAYYYVEQYDGFDEQVGLRLLFSPVLPAPKWAQKPLF